MKLLVISLLVFASISTKAQLKIYGGKKHNQFLGCMSCNTEDSNSIWSSFGDYGSMQNPNSIWNPDGKYGSKTSDFSPFQPMVDVTTAPSNQTKKGLLSIWESRPRGAP